MQGTSVKPIQVKRSFPVTHTVRPQFRPLEPVVTSGKGKTTMKDQGQRELIKRLDRLSDWIKEHQPEETRAKINELFQQVKMPGQNDTGAWIKAS